MKKNVKATYLCTLVNAGQPTSQDIFYHNKLGLFVGTSNPHTVSGVTTKITTKNTLLHYNLKKLDDSKLLYPDSDLLQIFLLKMLRAAHITVLNWNQWLWIKIIN